MKKITAHQNTSIQPSTIPKIQGGFENRRIFSKICVSIRKIKGIAVDSWAAITKSGEGGGFILGNYFTGFI
jgi:hypothetical protein